MSLYLGVAQHAIGFQRGVLPPSPLLFSAKLFTTLAAERGSTPDYTRSSIGSFRDYRKAIRYAAIGQPRFEGARTITNLCEHPIMDDLGGTSPYWTDALATLTNTPGISDAFGGNNAVKFTASASQAIEFYHIPAGQSARDINRTSMYIRLNSAIVGGTPELSIYQGNGVLSQNIYSQLVIGSYVRVECATTPVVATTATNRIGIVSASSGTTGCDFDVCFPQLEVVSGQENYNANEYVSRGLLSSPWHGAGVDGVKNFSTDKAGTPLPELTTMLGLLVEPSATQVVTYSTDFNNAVWTYGTGVTKAVDAVGSPDGSETGCTVTLAGGDAAFAVQKLVAVGDPFVVADAVHLKYSNHRWWCLEALAASGDGIRVWVDMLNRAAGSSAVVVGTSANAVYTGHEVTVEVDNWVRLSLSGKTGGVAVAHTISLIPVGADLSTVTTGNSGASVHTWNWQAEVAIASMSDIRNSSGSNVARAADSLQYPLVVASLTEISMQARVNTFGWRDNTQIALQVSDAVSAVDGLECAQNAAGNLRARRFVNGAAVSAVDTQLTRRAMTAVAASGSSTEIVVLKGATTATTVGVYANWADALTKLMIGQSPALSSIWTGNINSVKVYKAARTAAQLLADNP